MSIKTNVRKVPVVLLTILEPKQCLRLTESDLPAPQTRRRAAINTKLQEQASRLGVKPVERGKAIDNGYQPFEDMKGRVIEAVKIADMLENGGYRAVYVNIDGQQRKLECRPDMENEPDGMLSESQFALLLHAMREELDGFKFAGLWVNPGDDGEHANLVLRGIRDSDQVMMAHLNFVADNGRYFVEVPD